MDGEEHAAERRALIGESTVRRMACLRPRIQEIVDGFIDDLLAAEKRPVDVVRALALPVTSLAICGLLGVPSGSTRSGSSPTPPSTARTSCRVTW
ncbi:hypothetical protein [Actinoplanes sp. NBRC 103695]|uniref:hypothetical protein n=1 Tax=Actinoplanes sp. NBRC 103695 TaxID=3032202 RepID=UPI0024A02440|nr:hypothetical protein [Actinoplanes sp. NBRC 103695]GLZ01796.1 hypothetical protein Acsp02_90470 [Actinoplanes sp. NBRC 103695]